MLVSNLVLVLGNISYIGQELIVLGSLNLLRTCVSNKKFMTSLSNQIKGDHY